MPTALSVYKNQTHLNLKIHALSTSLYCLPRWFYYRNFECIEVEISWGAERLVETPQLRFGTLNYCEPTNISFLTHFSTWLYYARQTGIHTYLLYILW